jgi:dTDP-6-deoxy-L-talose 4-dehydrogenase (NAD+)
VKIWVTGARGFIGRHLVAQAAAAGHGVSAIVRPGSPLGSLHEGAAWLSIDLGDARAVVHEVERAAPDAVVHLAWYAHPADYLDSPENVTSLATTLVFAKAALLAGCRRMVAAGTCLEYADLSRARGEDDPLAPVTLYARSKHAAHLVLGELYERRSAALVWARLFHMHGPGEHPARLVPSVARALRERRPFALSPGAQLRDHLDVRDVASALLHLATGDVRGAVNVCSGEPVSLRALVEAVGREVGAAELLRFGERAYRDGEVMNLTGRADRLHATGWRPGHADLAQSIRDTVAALSPGV